MTKKIIFGNTISSLSLEIKNNMIDFLSLKKVTEKYASEIHEAVNRVVDSGWYLQGKENEQFEKDYAEFVGTKYCVGVANGLDALSWIIRANIELGRMQKGDEIIVPSNTFIASILAITDNGLKPILVEPREDTLVIDDEKIEAAITPKTKAVMIVHLYGRCAYTVKIGEICKKNNLQLFEDNAQAHGCTFEGKVTGAIGNAAGHSFYPGKNLGAFGDAGAVTTDDEELSKTVRSLANYGAARKYVFQYVGRNSRLDEIQAAVLDIKLKHLKEDNAWRQKIANYYYDHINNPFVRLPKRLDDANNVYHIFPILSTRRDELQAFMEINGIHTIIHYPIPPHKQECYREWNGMCLPITESIAEQELSLPISPVHTMEEIEKVVRLINNWK